MSDSSCSSCPSEVQNSGCGCLPTEILIFPCSGGSNVGIVAVDGCPKACARKTLEHASFEVTDPFVVTELGVRKSHDFSLAQEDVARVMDAVRVSLRKSLVASGGGRA